LIAIARRVELDGDAAKARALYEELLSFAERSDGEDSRARARLATLIENQPGPVDWRAVRTIVEQARSPRTEDWAALTNSEARALYGLQDFDGLRTLGRVFLRELKERPNAEPALVDATLDLLVRLAVKLDPADAMAWMAELGPARDLSSRLDRLAKISSESGRLDLAVAIYDRLRVDAAADRSRRGPSAAVDLARFTADRALLEYDRNDPEAFGSLVDHLVGLSRDEASHPLARAAPDRELVRICQDLLGRLAEAVPRDPDRRKFAGVLLDGIRTVAGTDADHPPRWREALLRYKDPLALLAGPYAVGRELAVKAAKRGAAPRKIRNLGEVVVPRLPPRIDPIDVPTPVPEVPSFLVYRTRNGDWTVGAPWMMLGK
jgi:hypothetical protein